VCWCAVYISGSGRGVHVKHVCFSKVGVYKSTYVVVINCPVDCKCSGLGINIVKDVVYYTLHSMKSKVSSVVRVSVV